MAKGIYKITNDRTGEVYIGQSNNMFLREEEHKIDLANGTHHNRGMQEDYNRGDTFSFEVLEYVDGSRNELHEREKVQIANHNSFYAGYNQTPGGEYDKYKGRYHYGGGRKVINYEPLFLEEDIKKRKKQNKKPKQNKKSTNSSNSKDDNWMMALFCICGILSIFISFAIIDIPIAFIPIFVGLLGIICIILWIVEELPKKIKSLFKKT